MQTINENNTSGERSKGKNLTDVCENTAAEIFDMNSNMKTLQDFSKIIGTPKDNEHLRTRISKIQGSMNKRISLITRDIKDLKHDAPKENKMLQLQTGKIEETFIAAITRYESLQQDIAQKQKSHVLLTVNVENPSPENELPDSQRASVALQILKDDEARVLEKQQAFQKLQTDIIDVHQIMGELGSMVNKQAESVGKVEKNISEVAANVQAGTEELDKAVVYKTRSRRRALYLLLAITIIVIVLIVVLYYQFGDKLY